ncbi:thioredoxin domain-containing protein [Rhodobacter sp. 24-YEA-8]|uniref:thioredoxin domain-containing protein n=1 Tax=Rhodobacter sp. 24-YEA-8 TaxID=1884310 RepID=UPI000B85C72C|nr:thioredoxin domain-containing protein [Rhodobacter sp. 24-YEA-8]
MKRRDLIRGSLGSSLGAMMLAGAAFPVRAEEMLPGAAPRELTHDPDQPVLGNPDGSVTIVEYFDYQCPFCRDSHPALLDYVRSDGDIRLVMKDWPIFGEASVRGVQLGLGSVALGRYAEVNAALMAGKGRRVDALRMDAAVRDAGLDPEAAIASFERERDKWVALIDRTMAEADFFGLPGTPAYLVGLNLFPRVTEIAELRAAVAAVRRG